MTFSSVRFDSSGPGQKYRYVIQVIGKDGPIFNPNNIRYLPVDDSMLNGIVRRLPSISGSMGNLFGLSWLNLGSSVANLALSATNLVLSKKILDQVRENSAKLDHVILLQYHILDRLNEVVERLARIEKRMESVDTGVWLQHLRNSLVHILKQSISNDGINFENLRRLEDDLSIFVGKIEKWGYCGDSCFWLPIELKDNLCSLQSFLCHTRRAVATAHNISGRGDPSRTLRMHPVHDYRPVRPLDYGRKYVSELITRKGATSCARGNARLDDSHSSRLQPERVASFRHRFQEQSSEVDDEINHLKRMLDGLKCATPPDVPLSLEALEQWEMFWLYKTDMGLIWRLHKELRALGDYSKEFPDWQEANSEPLESDTLLIDCGDTPWELPGEIQQAMKTYR